MIIAVDFDGVLAEDTGNFPEIGPPVDSMISFVKELFDGGHEVVLWTSRTDKALEDALKWCKERGLQFCAINDNAPSNKAKYASQYPNGTRKVSADVYIDDHNIGFISDAWDNRSKTTAIEIAIQQTRRLIKHVKR